MICPYCQGAITECSCGAQYHAADHIMCPACAYDLKATRAALETQMYRARAHAWRTIRLDELPPH